MKNFTALAALPAITARRLCSAAALLALLAAPLIAHAQLRPAVPAEQPANDAAFSAVESALQTRFTDVQSVVVALQGRIVYQFHRDAAPQALREQQSIAKSALSMLIGIALGQGHLASVDQPVVALMPAWAGLNSDPRAAAITLRHLLTMTAGFQYSVPAGTPAGQRAQAAWGRPLAAAPGTQFRYDNDNVALLAAVLEKATGMPLSEYARLNLVEPLGLAAPGLQGGLYLRTEDMARLGWLMLRGGAWDGRQVLPAAYVAAATRPQSAGGPPVGMPYGYLWWIVPSRGAQGAPSATPTFMASGYGGQMIWVHTPLDLVIAATSTVSDASQQRGQLVQLLQGGLFAVAQGLYKAP